MFKNHLIPFYAKVGVPILILINIALFIVGDTGDAVILDIKGEILGIKLNLDDFQRLSVISSTQKLWEAEAYLLAGLLGGFSIVWPYVKLFILSACWFLPVKILSRKRRTKVISFMDAFGKWSFVEFHFLIFILIIFDLKGGSPSKSNYRFYYI